MFVKKLSLRTVVLCALAVVVAAVAASIALASRNTAPIGTGVVAIRTTLGYQQSAAAGTGIVLTSNGEVLTNNHVISGASNLRTVTLGNSSKLHVGQAVTATGNAGGTGKLATVTGTITGLGKTITASDEQNGAEQLISLVETNAALQPGDSGGPLFDSSRRVIGMNTAASVGFSFETATSDSYAVPINRAVTIAKQIESGRTTAAVHVGGTPFLGVQIASAGGFGFGDSVAGGLVAGVVSGSPASKAGLAAGDVITAIAGRSVSSSNDVLTALLTKTPGMTVPLTWVDQSGAQQTATVTLASGPAL